MEKGKSESVRYENPLGDETPLLFLITSGSITLELLLHNEKRPDKGKIFSRLSDWDSFFRDYHLKVIIL